jgi:3-methyladenine DNA glycosylase/8-oxoguanine DNA glycosylase
LQLTVKSPYDFARSIQDYGWVNLAPCRWLPETGALERVERLSTGKVVLARIKEVKKGQGTSPDGLEVLDVEVEASGALTDVEKAELGANLRWMLRLDEDFEPFYERAKGDERLSGVLKSGRGRLLRSPTLFEDVVKTICTTNTTWRQTKGMVQRLVDLVGTPYPLDPALRAFPTPEQVAAAGVETLQKEVRLGYRSAYVHQLAAEVVAGQFPGNGSRSGSRSWKFSRNSADLKKQLKAIKGVGDYAANTLLMILGHYGELALDSEMRTFVKERYFDGEAVTDKEILAVYDEWGEWRYLAYWFDLVGSED